MRLDEWPALNAAVRSASLSAARHLGALVEVEAQRPAGGEHRLDRLPPGRAPPLHEARRDEDGVGNSGLPEHRGGPFGIVAIAVIEREGDEAPPVVGIGEVRRQRVQPGRNEAARQGGRDRIGQKGRRDRQMRIRTGFVGAGRADVVQREDDAATRHRGTQAVDPRKRNASRPARIIVRFKTLVIAR